MKEKLTFKVFYPHAPERVWQAITDPAALAEWLMPNNFKPQIGLRFRMSGFRSISGSVLEVEEGKRISYTWDDGEAGSPSVVRWTLNPKPGGTELVLEHEAAPEVPSYVLIEAAPNWRAALGTYLPRTLIVYAPDDQTSPKLERAGFRQEEVPA